MNLFPVEPAERRIGHYRAEWEVTTMFLGEYPGSSDNKSRFFIPAKFREQLGDKFIITKGLDNCLYIFTSEDFQSIHDKVKALPMTDEKARRFVRFFFGSAFEASPDGQGRVILPQPLREYAGLQKDLVSVGMSNRIEVWSKENWANYNGTSNFIDKETEAYLAGLGI